MKQRILLLFITIFSISLTAQEVPEIQTPLITKRTATWCGNCGSWGWTLFENLIEDNDDKAILMAAHHSGDLVSTVAQDITANFTAFSQPRFYVGNDDQNASSGNIAQKRTAIKDLVDNLSSQSPVANVGFEAFMIDGVISVNTKTRFFQAEQGEYFLGLYIIEDGVVNNQSQQGVVPHKYILRAGFSDSSFGIPLNGTDLIEELQDFDNSFEIDVNPMWNTDEVIVMGIIWKKEDDTYQVVNVNKTSEFALTSVENEISAVSNFEIFPTIISDQTTAKISLSESVQNVSMNIFDMTGKNVSTVFNGNLNAGDHNFDIQRNAIGAAGMYFLRVEIDGKVASEKLIFE